MNRRHAETKARAIVGRLASDCARKTARALTNQLSKVAKHHPEVLLPYGQHEHARVREAVAEVAGMLHDAQQLTGRLAELLEALLADGDEWVRRKAESSLYRRPPWETQRPEQLLQSLRGRVTKRQARAFLSYLWNAEVADKVLATAEASEDLSALLLEALTRHNDNEFQDDSYTWGVAAEERGRRIAATLRLQADRIRELFPPPCPAVLFDPQWRSPDVLQLARALHERQPGTSEGEGHPSAMLMLADALEEAGCRQPWALRHCRAPVEHDSQCWVIALVLGLDDGTT
jgi:hypothetical protein